MFFTEDDFFLTLPVTRRTRKDLFTAPFLKNFAQFCMNDQNVKSLLRGSLRTGCINQISSLLCFTGAFFLLNIYGHPLRGKLKGQKFVITNSNLIQHQLAARRNCLLI